MKPDIYVFLRLVGTTIEKPNRKLKANDANKFYCIACREENTFTPGSSNQILCHVKSDKHNERLEELNEANMK